MISWWQELLRGMSRISLFPVLSPPRTRGETVADVEKRVTEASRKVMDSKREEKQ